jgi:hypothetical protein
MVALGDKSPGGKRRDRMRRKDLQSVMAFFSALLVVAVMAPQADGGDRIGRAKELFDRYIRLERAFDPAVAELYSDDAIIRNKRTYPDGQVRELTMPAPKFKQLVRAVVPLAKLRGDTSTYSDVTYTPEGDGVRIEADRYSKLKKYHSPISILVKPSGSGAWLIYEEISESQP